MGLGLIGKLTVMFGADFKGFDKAMSLQRKKLQKWSRDTNRLGNTLTRNLTLPILALGAGAVKLASDFEESLNKVRVSFGDSSTEVEKFAETTLKSFGIAEGSALEMAALFGDMGTALGVTQESAAKMSNELVGLAGDLASFKNISIDIAQTALAGIFTGETESLKKLGIMTTEATLKNSDYFKSLNKTWTSLTNLEKIQVRYMEVLRQSNNATGDFLRTQDGFANQMRILQETIKETGAEFGKSLIPLATDLVKILTKGANAINNMTQENREWTITIGLITLALGPVLKALAALLNVIDKLFLWIPKLTKVILSPVGLIAALSALWIKLDEGDGWIDNSRRKFQRLREAIFGVNKESKKLDFSKQKGIDPTDPNYLKFIMGRINPKAPTHGANSGGLFSNILSQPSNGEGENSTSTRITGITKSMERLGPVLLDTGRAWRTYYSDIAESSTMAAEAQERLTKITALFEDIMTSAMTSALDSQEGFFTAFIENLKKAIKQLIAQMAVIMAIKLLLGEATTVKAALKLASTKVLGFAEGGLVTGPTVGLIGEGAGTSASNPEVVAPLDKLKSMISGGSQQVEVYGRISGNDIFLSNQRGQIGRFRSV